MVYSKFLDEDLVTIGGRRTAAQELQLYNHVYAIIGAILVNCAKAERNILRAVSTISTEGNGWEKRMSDEGLSYAQSKNSLRALFSHFASLQQLEDLEANFSLLDQCKIVRNNLAHDYIFYPDPDTNDPNILEVYKFWKKKDFERAKTNTKLSQEIDAKKNRVKYTLSFLEKTNSQLHEAASDIRRLASDVWIDLAKKSLNPEK